MAVTSVLETGAVARIRFHAAPVRKPLVAVSALTDLGSMTVFNQKESVILPAGSPEITQIEKLVAQAKGKTPLHREGGIFSMRNWIRNEPPVSGFARQGR